MAHLLVEASLAAAEADGVDAATLSFLTAQALEDRRKEEAEKKRKEAKELEKLFTEVDVLLHVAQPTPLQLRRLEELRRAGAFQAWSDAAAPGWRRRRRRLPRTSSRPFRQLQRRLPSTALVVDFGSVFFLAGYAGFGASHAVFPSFFWQARAARHHFWYG